MPILCCACIPIRHTAVYFYSTKTVFTLYPYIRITPQQSTKHEIRETEAQIQNLTNQAAVREGKYKQRFGEEGKLGLEVRNWAARNSERLKGPVVGPIGLEVRGFQQ